MILSSRSELNDQFVVGSRSFHLRFGALKSPATITLFVFTQIYTKEGFDESAK